MTVSAPGSGMTRRSFLRSLGLGGLALPAWFPRVVFSAQPSARRDVLVCVFLRGGVDGLNAVVPFGDDDYHASRPLLSIPSPRRRAGGAIDLDGFFGLHPALAPLAELYKDGVLGFVHATGSPDRTHSHFDAMDFMERGTPGSKSVPSGWIARHLATLDTANQSPFRAVGVGPLLPFSLRGPTPVTALQSVSTFGLRGQPSQQADLPRFQARLAAMCEGDGWLDQRSRQTLAAVATLAAAQPGSYRPAHGARYPASDFGAALRQVAQLIKADLGLEVACVDLADWDFHAEQGGAVGAMADLLADLAKGLSAFHTDLGERMRGITLVTMSEFGRRLRENASGGTDHGHGSVMLLLGGGVGGGRVHTVWPGLAPEQLYGPGDLAVTTDYRTVLAEVLERRVGNARLAEVFPGFTAPAYLGVVRSR
jgi:uncharacterized protein (DUF1501 family)